MKKVLLGAMLIASLVSCNKSPEDKANALISEDIKKVLYHAETYEPVETRVDSAFTPFDDPVFYDRALQLCQLIMAMNEYDREMKDAKSTMAIWSGPYMSVYAKNEYQEAQNKYDENSEKKNKMIGKAKKLVEELKNKIDEEQLFIGFKVRHRYRANNNAGKTLFGEVEYLFDKDMNKIVTSYNVDSDEYKAVHLVYKQILGEDTFMSDDAISDNDL